MKVTTSIPMERLALTGTSVAPHGASEKGVMSLQIRASVLLDTFCTQVEYTLFVHHNLVAFASD